ncbi:hypothetical protein ATANTOWER_001805 [Ataeniobius toweri]|uniref:Immunoglobulin V-set domain-containing protein n=1 Tax=Ataeniobius toweri TaxID=208326 RepID=A0ABU7A3T3_9TELE|nr:hypothetical protein [Ataeniobius toweri]
MKAKVWSCVLGLLCMPAEVILNTWTASQSPLTISNVRVNSSLEIICTISLENPTGLALKRRFLGNTEIIYLSFQNGVVTKNTTAEKFRNRIGITQEQLDPGVRYKFKLQLSLLGLDDTDLYYCHWTYIKNPTYVILHVESNGTVIIVREHGPVEQCSDHTVDLTLICMSIVAFTALSFIFVGVMIMRCRKFKKRFTPGRPYAPPLPPRRPQPPRPNHSWPIYPQQQTAHHCPYMMTSTNDYGIWANLQCSEETQTDDKI